MLSQLLKRFAFVATIVAVLCVGGVASAQAPTAAPDIKECTPFGCHPHQGNLIQELGGMVVLCVLVSGAVLVVSRRYVK